MPLLYKVTKVVDMIPKWMSDETNDDGETNITVNQKNPSWLCASVTRAINPFRSGYVPFYFSTDGGDTWSLNLRCLDDGNFSEDMTLRFSPLGNNLYIAYLNENFKMKVVRVPHIAGSIYYLLESIDPVPVPSIGPLGRDQPWIETANTGMFVPSPIEWADVDLAYVGNNDLTHSKVARSDGRTAALDFSIDASNVYSHNNFHTLYLEKGSTGDQDSPCIRPAIHPSGRVYAAFIRFKTPAIIESLVTSDIVILRDDAWGRSSSPFSVLTDPVSKIPGQLVASDVTIELFHLGGQRSGGELAIGVDRRHLAGGDAVYVAWCDTSSSDYILHLRRSLDGGKTWGGDLKTIINAIHPGLAINENGDVGLLYQQQYNELGTEASRWQTHVEIHNFNFTESIHFILADVEDNSASGSVNALGDYVNLISFGYDFYGSFSAYNDPSTGFFPYGIKWQRNVRGTTLMDVRNRRSVAPSVDPFFFKVSFQ